MEQYREMLDIIYAEEFSLYKDGFVNGKNDILNLLLNNINYCEEVEDNNYGWYELGYADAYNYYQNLFIEKNQVSIDEVLGERAWFILNEFYFQRVAECNKYNDSEVPAIILKLSPPREI